MKQQTQTDQFLSLKHQLFLLILLPCLALALLLSSVAIYLHHQTLNKQFEQYGKLLTLNYAPRVQYILLNNTNEDNKQQINQALQNLVNELLNEEGVRALSISVYHGNDGVNLIHAGPKMRPVDDQQADNNGKFSHLFSKPSQHFSLLIKKNELKVLNAFASKQQLPMDDAIARIDLELDKNLLQIDKYASTFLLITLLLTGILCIAYFAYLSATRINQPIQGIRFAIARIKEGRLSTRVKGPLIRGELHELIQGVNSMAESLQAAHEEMQHSIDQATEDLRSTLETIEIQNIELDLARKEAVEGSRIKSQFLANISHEIRTPLNSIIGFTNLLLKTNLNPEQQDQLQTIQKSSENLLAIINDILDFSKIEAGKLSLDIGVVNIPKVLEEVIEILSPLAKQKNLEQVLSIDPDVPRQILSDALRIKQVVTNLLNNAIKFSDSGRLQIRVSVESGRVKKGMLKISVSDQGIGLTEKAKKHLFEAFHQSDASNIRRFQGTGLGLTISRHLVEMLGGEIGVDSLLGQGSTFWFTLPADSFTETYKVVSTKNSHPENMNHQQLHQNTSPPKILAVDDNPANLKLICALLSDLGLDYEACSNGKTAIELAKRYHHDLTFMDIQMPDLDGVSCAREIRNFDKRFSKSRPIIALTAHAFDNEKEQLLKEGFNDCLTKPIILEQLVNIIEHWTGFYCAQNIKAENINEETASNNLQNINIEEGIRLAGSKADLADEMLAMLIEHLPKDKPVLLAAYSEDNREQLLEKVHYIHGATRYCGVPLLRQAASDLEGSLKKREENITSHFEYLITCIDALLAEYQFLNKPLHQKPGN